MKLHLTSSTGHNLFTAYGSDYLTVNQHRFVRSVIVLPDRIIDDWEPRQINELTEAHFDFLASLEAEIILLGTGAVQRFPHPRLTAPFAAKHIGFEVMDTFAAARTYNILMGEGRRVAAALLL